MDNLTTLYLGDNPLQTLILSEDLAAGNLSGVVAQLRDQGVAVYTYPVTGHLSGWLRNAAGAFAFTFQGPPGTYRVMASTNLAAWTEMGSLTNRTGSVTFTNAAASGFPRLFHRALRRELW